MHPGWIGAIAGCTIGLAGGIIGTYYSIKNTNGPRERAFMVKSATIAWVLGLVFIAVLLLVPSPYRFLAWIPYAILLPLGITYGNKIQQRIRREEAEEREGRTP